MHCFEQKISLCPGHESNKEQQMTHAQTNERLMLSIGTFSQRGVSELDPPDLQFPTVRSSHGPIFHVNSLFFGMNLKAHELISTSLQILDIS